MMMPVQLPAGFGILAPRRRSRVPWIIGGVVVAIAGLAIVLVARRGGSAGTAPGEATRDEAVRATFASLGKGELDAMVSRSGATNVSSFAACEVLSSDVDEQEDIKEVRREFERAIAREKGATLEVLAIDEPTKPAVFEAGTKMTKLPVVSMAHGCKAKVPITSHDLAVKLKVRRNGKVAEASATINVLEAGGRWMVNATPKIIGCSAAIARIALVGSAMTGGPAEMNKLEAPMIATCTDDQWSAEVIACATKAAAMSEVEGCLRQLTNEQKAKLGDVLVPPKGPSSSGGADPKSHGADPVVATNATVGETPEPAPLGDLWLWKRKDGSVRVAAPTFEIVFPSNPTVELVKGAKRPDGSSLDVYTLRVDRGANGLLLQLEVVALGRDAKDFGAVATLKAIVAKVGPVTETDRKEAGADIAQLETVDKAGARLRVHAALDLPRGMFVTATTATPTAPDRAIADRFLASFHPRQPADPLDDPKLVTGIRTRHAGKKFQIHDPKFTLDVPWATKTTRQPRDPGKAYIETTIVASRGRSRVTLQVQETAPWDALHLSPAIRVELAAADQAALEKQLGGKVVLVPDAEVAGMPMIKLDPASKSKHDIQKRWVWNRFQHRTYLVTCVDTPCDPVVKTFTFTAPSPTN